MYRSAVHAMVHVHTAAAAPIAQFPSELSMRASSSLLVCSIAFRFAVVSGCSFIVGNYNLSANVAQFEQANQFA